LVRTFLQNKEKRKRTVKRRLTRTVASCFRHHRASDLREVSLFLASPQRGVYFATYRGSFVGHELEHEGGIVRPRSAAALWGVLLPPLDAIGHEKLRARSSRAP
jgi:hypothetical protein